MIHCQLSSVFLDRFYSLLRCMQLRCPIANVAMIVSCMCTTSDWVRSQDDTSVNAKAESKNDQALPIDELTLHTVGGTKRECLLTDINQQGMFVFQRKTEQLSVSGSDIVRWGAGRSDSVRPLVWLNDDTWLAGAIEWKDSQSLTISSDWFTSITLPLDSIRGILWQPRADFASLFAQQQAMREHVGRSDKVWDTQGETLSGVLKIQVTNDKSRNIASVPTWSLAPSAPAAKVIDLDSKRLLAAVFSPILRPEINDSSLKLSVVLRDGTRLASPSIQKTDRGTIRLRLESGLELESLDKSTQFVLAVRSLECHDQAITWLSRTEPARYRYFKPSMDQLEWPLGRDQGMSGEMIFSKGQRFDRFVVTHAPSQTAYRWNGSNGRLLGTVSIQSPTDGIEPSTASAKAKVLMARNGQLQEVYQSPLLRNDQREYPIDVSVRDAQLIVLIADEADLGHLGDVIAWREIRIAPETP